MNMLLNGSALGFVAPLLLNVAVEAVGPPIPPSSTNSNSNSVTTLVVPVYSASLSSSFPTNPNPPPDQARSLAKPLFVAQVPSQVAQGDGQPNVPVPPPNYGRDGAREINNLQGQIERTDRELTQGLRDHNQAQNERLQQLLKITKK
jgi:hypothetical protein